MRRSKSIAAEGRGLRAAARRHRGGLAACALAGVIGLAAALPASAQWIGTPGGSVTSEPPAALPAPTEQAAPVAPASTPEPALISPGSMQSPGFSPGFGAPGGFSQGGMAPGGMAPGGMQAGPGPADAATARECQTSIEKLRDDLEKRGAAIQTASSKKRPPSELCPIFRNFVSAQQKFYDYLNTNKARCGVPSDVLPKMKENLTGISSVRNKVCDAAKAQAAGAGGPSGPPTQGAVSSGLGLPSGLPTTANSRPGGVFDTLGGNALR
ncbi:hypothetical protein MKI84_18915 [Ancylobacter sp. A5.8]|uniref:hypothetical protein n=1 Tax=Ancylobacter gelatini TaxID=2919920 RepID=UPI001F4D6A27|nr:hypothetical protein [Ancylobacter gelatini]MCJ8144998.1 hypothetical protein [Ancylobacter gelatini]